MKRLAAVAALIMAAGCGSSSPPTNPTNNTGPITFTAQMSGANENPPITGAEANGTGTATITMTVTRDAASGNITGGGTLNFSVPLRGLPGGTAITAAHIHNGPVGQNAGVFIGVTGISAASPVVMDGSGAGTINVSNVQVNQDQATQMFNNPAGFYFNVHTAANPGGVSRGQMVKQ